MEDLYQASTGKTFKYSSRLITSCKKGLKVLSNKWLFQDRSKVAAPLISFGTLPMKLMMTSRKGDMDRSRAVVFPVFWVLSPFSGHLAEAWLSSGPSEKSEAGKVSLLISWHHTVEAFLHVPATASLPLRFTQSTGGIPYNGYYTDSCIKIQRTFPAQPHNSVGIRTTNTNSTPSSYALIFLFRFHEPPAYFQTAT